MEELILAILREVEKSNNLFFLISRINLMQLKIHGHTWFLFEKNFKNQLDHIHESSWTNLDFKKKNERPKINYTIHILVTSSQSVDKTNRAWLYIRDVVPDCI